jgi:hypothetical protein
MTLRRLMHLLRDCIFALTTLSHSPDVHLTINVYQAPPPPVAMDQAPAQRCGLAL